MMPTIGGPVGAEPGYAANTMPRFSAKRTFRHADDDAYGLWTGVNVGPTPTSVNDFRSILIERRG